MVQVIVTRITGSIVCQFEAEPGWNLQNVKEWICKCDGVCPCKQQIVADSEVLRDGSLLEEHIADCTSQLALTLLIRNMHLNEDGLCICGSRDCPDHPALTTQAADWRAEGFCASCLVKEGFHGLVLLDAGFNAQELRDIGVSAGQLAGISDSRPECVKTSERKNFCWLGELVREGFSVTEIMDAFSCYKFVQDGERFADTLVHDGLSVKEILDAGIMVHELVRAYFKCVCMGHGLERDRFSVKEMLDGGFTIEDLVCADIRREFWENGFGQRPQPRICSVRTLLDAGVDVKQMRDAALTTSYPWTGMMTPWTEIWAFSAREFLGAGIDLEQLRCGGFRFQELLDAGLLLDSSRSWFSTMNVEEFVDAGFEPHEFQWRSDRCLSCWYSKRRNWSWSSSSTSSSSSKGCSQCKCAQDLTTQAWYCCGGDWNETWDDWTEDPWDEHWHGPATMHCCVSSREFLDAGIDVGQLQHAGFCLKQLPDVGASFKQLLDVGVLKRTRKSTRHQAKLRRRAARTSSTSSQRQYQQPAVRGQENPKARRCVRPVRHCRHDDLWTPEP